MTGVHLYVRPLEQGRLSHFASQTPVESSNLAAPPVAFPVPPQRTKYIVYFECALVVANQCREQCSQNRSRLTNREHVHVLCSVCMQHAERLA